MKRTILIILAAFAPLVQAAEPAKKAQVYLFAGQSNMDGRADAAKLSEDDLRRLKAVQDRIEFHYNWKPVSKLDVTDPAAWTKKKFNFDKCFGPELFFGIALAEANPNERFVFIKRAKGGTSLYGCWNPDWTLEKATLMKEQEQPKLYHDFIKYTDKVLSSKESDSYEIKGMLWVQGESDSGVKKRGPLPSKTYGKNLQALIKSVRAHHKLPNLPFLMLQVGGGEVVKGMKQTAKEDANVFFIEQSKDETSPYYLPKNPPPIGHYTTAGMKKIGLNFYKSYAAIGVAPAKVK